MNDEPLEPETDDDLALEEAPPLSPKELAFCEAYGNPESASYGNARKSAEAAGYVQAHNAGWKLRRRPSIRAKLQEYHKAVTVAVGRVLSDLENERLLALAKGDVASAVRASELMGKHLGMFRDNLALDVGPTREYSEAEQVEARRITAFLLANPAPGELPAEDQPLALPVHQEPTIGE